MPIGLAIPPGCGLAVATGPPNIHTRGHAGRRGNRRASSLARKRL